METTGELHGPDRQSCQTRRGKTVTGRLLTSASAKTYMARDHLRPMRLNPPNAPNAPWGAKSQSQLETSVALPNVTDGSTPSSGLWTGRNTGCSY